MNQELPAGELPAFPFVSEIYGHSGGMTLRDYFAAKAMEGWIAAQPSIHGEKLDGTKEHANLVAWRSYVMADAMLAERNKK